jgi:origin recognition complex subunit 5
MEILLTCNAQIPELTNIFIIKSPRPHFLHTPGVPHIHFPPYSKAEAIQILALHPSSVPSRAANPVDSEYENQIPKDTKEIWTRFCGAVWDTLSKHSGRDILSFRDTCNRLWPQFSTPLHDGTFTTKDFSRLLVSKRSLLQNERVLVPSIIPTPIISASQALQTPTTPTKEPRNKAAHQSASIATQLPLFSRLLLIAAYLASYTPARNDQLLFSKSATKGRRKKGGGTAKSRHRVSKHRKISGKLLGPQAFVMERLLAIFHAVRLDAGGSASWSSTADVPMAVATLASLRLIVRMGAGADVLDASTKWKVNVGWDVVRGVARSVGVEVEDFLID